MTLQSDGRPGAIPKKMCIHAVAGRRGEKNGLLFHCVCVQWLMGKDQLLLRWVFFCFCFFYNFSSSVWLMMRARGPGSHFFGGISTPWCKNPKISKARVTCTNLWGKFRQKRGRETWTPRVTCKGGLDTILRNNSLYVCSITNNPAFWKWPGFHVEISLWDAAECVCVRVCVGVCARLGAERWTQLCVIFSYFQKSLIVVVTLWNHY